MKVAIIGAGYTGMCIGEKLSQNNVKVTIFEKESKVGGMTRNVKLENETTDRYYRHLFKSDTYLIELAKELGVEVKWFKSRMGYYIEDKLYDWGQPLALLKFKPLNFWKKFRFGLSVVKIKLIKNWKPLEQYTIKEWFVKNKWEDIYNIIWKPLLQNKFGKYEPSISMVWLWGKINLRQSEQGLTKETLGYIDFEEMNKKMKENLEKNGVEFKLETVVKEIQKSKDGFSIKDSQPYDIVISTISYDATSKLFNKLLNSDEKEKLSNTKYIGAKTLIMETKKKMTNYYWLNMADEEFPFCGIIDYHNMENFEAKNVIYISNYLDTSTDLYKMNKEQLLDTYLPYLKKVSNDFDKKDIIKYEVIDEEYAQPIIEVNYSNQLLENKLSEKGLYICTLPQIYPEDRGVNYAIRSGYKLADEIIKENL